MYGIAGDGGTNEHLSIKNANVTAIGTEYASIADLASLSLTDCVLVQPSGAAFDPVKHCVALNGTPVKSKVVITNDPNGIVSPSADVPTAAQGLYTERSAPVCRTERLAEGHLYRQWQEGGEALNNAAGVQIGALLPRFSKIISRTLFLYILIFFHSSGSNFNLHHKGRNAIALLSFCRLACFSVWHRF